MIRLVNESKRAVVVSVNGEDAGTILAQQTKELAVDAPQMQIVLKHTYPSYAKADTAHLSVEVTYTIEATKDITLIIYREKIHFDLNGYYDALLLHDDDSIIAREYRVSDVQKVRRKLRQYKILYSLIVDPIERHFGPYRGIWMPWFIAVLRSHHICRYIFSRMEVYPAGTCGAVNHRRTAVPSF